MPVEWELLLTSPFSVMPLENSHHHLQRQAPEDITGLREKSKENVLIFWSPE